MGRKRMLLGAGDDGEEVERCMVLYHSSTLLLHN